MNKAGPYLLWLLVVCCLVFMVHTPTKAQVNVVEVEYFFDIDPGLGNATPVAFTPDDSIDLTLNVSVAGLSAGYHQLLVRAKDANGNWSVVTNHQIFVNPLVSPIIPPPPPFTLIQGEYFFDKDPGPGEGTAFLFEPGDTLDLMRTFSVSGLDTGIHLIGIRIRELAGMWGVTQWAEFDVVDTTAGQPLADFTCVAADTGMATLFTNTSLNTTPLTKYQWDVDGDGIIDYTSENVSHTYSTPGLYDVTLTVYNPGFPVSTTGIRALYRFYAGSLENDAATLPTGALTGDMYPVTGRSGDPNGAYSNDTAIGVAQFAAGPGALSLNEFSVSYWFKGGDHEISLALTGGAEYMASSIGGNHVLNSPGFGVEIDNAGGATVQDSNWHHLAVTWTPNTVDGFKSYLDGQLVDVDSAGSQNVATLQNLTIGGISGSNARGAWDDIFVFRRALDSAEIVALYEDQPLSSIKIKQVLIGPDPSNMVIASGATEFCDGDSVLLTAPAGTGHLWNTGEFSQSIVVKRSGYYRCAYTDVNGNGKLSSTVQVIVNELMDIDLTIYNETNGQMNGSAGASVSGGNNLFYDYLWNTGDTLPSVSGLSAGNYSLTVSDGKCPEVLMVNLINEVINPLAGIVEAEYFIDGVDPGPGNAVAFPITQGDTIGAYFNPDISALSFGKHFLSVRVKDELGNWSITNTEQFFLEEPIDSHMFEPQGDIVAVEYFFNDNDPGVGNANSLPPFGQSDTIQLMFGANVSGLDPGFNLISVRVLDTNGKWSVTNQATFFVDITPPDNSPDFPFPMVQAEYFIDDADPGPGNANPLPVPFVDSFDINRTVDVTGLDTGWHKISIRTLDVARNWSVTHTETFRIDTPDNCLVPNPDFANTAANAGQPMTFTNMTTNGTGGSTVAWDINADGSVEYTSINTVHVFPASGTYDVSLTVDNGNNCSSTVIKQVVVGPLLVDTIAVSGDLEFCLGDSVVLTAPPGSNYIWSTADTVQEIAVYTSGVYQATYLDASGFPAATNTVSVLVNDTMDVALTVFPATNGQFNGSAGVSVTGGSSFAYSYLWSNGATTPSISGLPPVVGTVMVDDGKCPVTLSVIIPNVIVNPLEGIVAAEYFIDPDPGPGNGTSIPITQGDSVGTFFDVSTLGLLPGEYKLSVRVLDELGNWSITQTGVFQISDPALDSPIVSMIYPLTEVEYFFDEDPGPGNAFPGPAFPPTDTVIGSITTVPVNLDPGFHQFSVRAKNANGEWGVTQSTRFFVDVLPPPNAPDVNFPIVEAEYYFGDADPGVGNGINIPVVPTDSFDLNRTIDVSTLNVGSHTLNVRVRDIARNWSIIKRASFIVDTANCPLPQVDFSNSMADANQVMNFINLTVGVNATTTYAWDINADGSVEYMTQNAAHIFPSPGTYDVKLTVDNGSNCVVSLIRQVEVGPILPDQLTVVGSLNFCQGDSAVLIAPAGSGYVWNTGDTTQMISAKNSGVYQCGYTDAQGNPEQTNAVSIVVYDTMTIVLTTYDETNSMTNGSAGVLVSGGNSFIYSYNWSNGKVLPSIFGLSAGTYTVTVDDGRCPEAIDVQIANIVVPAPEGIVQAEYFLDALDPGPGNGIAVAISEGDSVGTYFDINTTGLPSGHHKVSVRVKDNDQNWSITGYHDFYIYDTIEVEPVELLGDILSAEFFIDATDPGPGNATAIPIFAPSQSIISNFSVSLAPFGLASGTHIFSVRAKDSYNRWSITESATFNNCNPLPPTTGGPDVVICTGDTIFLSAATVPGAGYFWTGPNGYTSTDQNPVIVGASTAFTGDYFVSTESDSGCYSVPDVVEVRVDTIPDNPGVITGTATICAEQDTGNFFVPPVAGAVDYLWDLPMGAFILAGNNTNSIAVDFTGMTDSSGLVRVTAANSCGSAASPFLIVNRFNDSVPASVMPIGPLTICEGESVMLSANVGPSLSYQWKLDGADIAGANQSTYVATLGGVYTVVVSLPNGCSNSADVVVNLLPSPQVEVVDTFLGGTLYALAQVSGGIPPYTFSWNTGATTSFIVVPGIGTYSVTVTGSNGCATVDSISITSGNFCASTTPVTGLTETNLQYTKATLTWDLLPGTVSWQLRGRKVGLLGFQSFNIPNGSQNFLNASILEEATCYEWEVRAFCDSAGTTATPWSGLKVFCTDTCPEPSGLATVNITQNGAKLMWNQVPEAIGYRLMGGLQGFPPVTIDLNGGATTMFNAGGLAPNSTYYWNVTAGCTDGKIVLSETTPNELFTTLPGALPKMGEDGTLFSGVGVGMYPNPADDEVIIDVYGTVEAEALFIRVFDVTGRTVIQQGLSGNAMLTRVPLDVSELSSGIYEVEVTGDVVNAIEKLVVE